MDRQRVRPGRRSLLAALGLVVAVAPASVSASALQSQAAEPAPQGGAVFTLTEHGSGWPGPISVVDSHGNTTVVWAKDPWRGAIRAVRRPVGREWGRPVTIGRGTSPMAAVDARGNVTVVYVTHPRRRTAGVSAARRLVEGGWQHPLHLSKDKRVSGYVDMPGNVGPFGAHHLDLAVNARGDAVVVWQWGSYDENSPYRIQSNFRPVGGPWRGLARLTEPDWSENPQVAIGPEGNVTVVYTNPDSRGGRTFSRRRIAGEGWRGPVRVVRVGTDGDLVVDRAGTVTYTYTGHGDGVSNVKVTRRPVGTVAWPKPRQISPQGRDIWSWSQVQHPAGAISVAMQRRSGRIDAVRRPAGGPWRAPVQVSPPAPRATPPVVATTASETLFVVWENESLGLRGRIRDPAGGWTPTFQVSAGTGNFTQYEASIYPNGDGLAVWEVGYSTIKARRMFR